MKLSSNSDFFLNTGKENPWKPAPEKTSGESPAPAGKRIPYRRSAAFTALVKETSDVLTRCGFAKMAGMVGQIYKDASKERFTVSVVGEFNHGKSTFLNRLLENPSLLPTGDLPTTAILTRIRYANQPQMAVFDEKGIRIGNLEVKPESWMGLVANNFGKEEPKGSVIIGIPNSWLGRNSLEIIDCPGANDLSEERARVIGDVLSRSDGAIIALNANQPLSMSEKTFIQNRIIGKRIPFTLIIINKLDLVKTEDRSKVLKFFKNALALNKLDIPFYVPYDVEMPDDTFDDVIGMDKVKDAIVSWAEDPERGERIEAWLKARIAEVVTLSLETLYEKEKLLKQDERQRVETIAKKKQKLDDMEIEWNDLANQFQFRANACYSSFLEKVGEYTDELVERLQYEASHAGSPERWWKEDYPYRLKVELVNLAGRLENAIAKIISTDAKWFNDRLNDKFRTFVQTGPISITDKDEFKENTSRKKLEFEDLTKKQNYARIGTVALSLALAPAWGIVATMGVGTAGTLITNSIFRKVIEEQRKALKEAIAKDIPSIVFKATENSEKRILALYEDMLKDSDEKKKAWLESQETAIKMEDHPADSLKDVASNISSLTEINRQLV